MKRNIDSDKNSIKKKNKMTPNKEEEKKKKKEFDESENICSKLVSSMIKTIKDDVEKIPKLIEAIENKTSILWKVVINS